MADLCCKHDCSEQLFYHWKSEYARMDVSAAKRLKEPERENAEVNKWWRIKSWIFAC